MSENTKWIVYRHTSPSGKVYIGITKNSTIRRWGRNGNGYAHSAYFKNAIAKYGWDNIKHEVLFTDLSESKAKQLEQDLIRHYKRLNISYNCTDGGDGTLGWHPTDELKKLWSKIRKGRIITEEWRRHISESSKGRKMPEGHGRQAGLIAKLRCSIPVVQISLTGEYVQTFNSARDAGSVFGNKKYGSSISQCCKGKSQSYKKYFWMYKREYDLLSEQGILEQKIQEKIYAYQHRYKYERTEEIRRKISEARKGRQYKTPEQMQAFIKLGQELSKKCVLQLSINDIPIAVFDSAVEINKKLGFGKTSISHCCRGVHKTAYGFKWQFITKEEYDEYKKILEAA